MCLSTAYSLNRRFNGGRIHSQAHLVMGGSIQLLLTFLAPSHSPELRHIFRRLPKGHYTKQQSLLSTGMCQALCLALHVTHFNSHLPRKYYYSPHFAGKETEAIKTYVT